MNYKIKYIFFWTLALALQSCSSQNKSNEETALEREKRLAEEYHRQVVIAKGKEALFIPKSEVGWYFDNQNFTTLDKAEINDNICFFDTLGNIQYQALVIENMNGTIQIKCQNLKTAEYYNTVLDVSKIPDLEKNYPYEIKVYKSKK